VTRAETPPAPDESVLRAEAQLQVAEEQGAQDLFNALTAFEDSRNAGLGLADAAEAAGIEPIVLEGISRGGALPDGSVPLTGPAAVQLLEAMFSQEEGLESDTIDLADEGYAAFVVTSIAAPRPQTLQEVRSEVEELYLGEALRGRLNEVADAIIARINAGEPLGAIRDSYEGGVEVGRIGASRLVPPDEQRLQPVAARGFDLGLGETTSLPRPDGGRYVVHVEEITPAPPADPVVLDQIELTLRNEVFSDTEQALMSSLQRDYGITTNQRNLDRALGLSDTAP